MFFPILLIHSLRFHFHIKVILQLLSVFPFSYTNECKWRSSLLQNCQDIENSMSKREILMANFISIVLVRHLLYAAYKYHVTAVEDVHTVLWTQSQYRLYFHNITRCGLTLSLAYETMDEKTLKL